MSAPEWEKIKDVFARVSEQPKERQREFLREACTGDLTLLVEVESLLNASDQPEALIEQDRYAAASMFRAEPAGIEGKMFGAYKVIREIGRGGMGAVYLARRDDAEYRKFVAIKVVRRDQETEEIVRRFRNERQILAGLDHPNIARLLDGGATEEGLPYLVMEYVEGTPITDYSDNRRLTTRERLNLFMTVCAAVQHAHQNLVVHRDLKPSNILITADGAPKLLDFGIAKVLNPELSALSMEHTLTALRMLTPEYASPEQVRGEKLTTTSDIYSLGVVLYELLSGHRPYRASGATPHELARVICEQEPTKPSTVVTNVEVVKRGHPDSQTITPESVSRARDTEPDKLRRRLSGDLDNIVLKALRKEPQRRYDSAAELAGDIRRHLDGLPVIARKDTFRYRATKFVKRNRLAVSAAVLVVTSLVVGLVSTAWQAKAAKEQARIAAQQRDRVRTEAAKSERINAFLQNMFSYADPSWYSPGRDRRGDMKVIEVVNEAAERLEKELADQPEVRAELHHTIGNTYRALGRLDLAERHFQSALELSRAVYGEQHPKVARDLYYLGAARQLKLDYTSAERLYRQAIAMMRATEAGNANLPYMLQDLGGMLIIKGDAAAAEPLLLEALEMFRQRYGDNHYTLVSGLLSLGRMYETLGQRDKADATYQESIARVRRLGDRQALSEALTALGQAYLKRGEYARAEPLLREALDIARELLGEDNIATTILRDILADLYKAWGKPELAKRLIQPSSAPTSSR